MPAHFVRIALVAVLSGVVSAPIPTRQGPSGAAASRSAAGFAPAPPSEAAAGRPSANLLGQQEPPEGAAGAASRSGSVQAEPLKGIVWLAPDDEALARGDLRKMREAGVEAVRTGLLGDEDLLDLADSLGLSLFLDLPVARLPAARLLDTLGHARVLVDAAAALARAHPSIRGIGLARDSDTSDPSACAYFEELTTRVHRSAPDVMTYYLTRFSEADACSASVDLVLANLLGRRDPDVVLRRAPRSPTVRGIGALGTGVRDDSLRGVRVPASPERQARYFEEHLGRLDSSSEDLRAPAVFVHRWRDVPRDAAEERDFGLLGIQRYGLRTRQDVPRPAFDVVSGIYTGRQEIFAFDPGTPPAESPPWLTLLGWCMLGALGVVYALSPRFRHTIPRYFQAHYFFCDAVREGRDVLFGASITMLGALGATCGMVTFAVVDAVGATDPFMLAVHWLPAGAQDALSSVFVRPLLFVLLVGCIYAAAVLVWTGILSLFSRFRHEIAPVQALMLVVWPQWTLLGVMVGAMVATSQPGPNLALVGVLAAAWLLFSMAAAGRALYDFLSVTRISPWLLVPAGLLNPVVVAAVGLLVLSLVYEPEFEYLLHAAVRP